jgi:hypothetical protein
MSLGIALKGTAGVVLAADSRVTLFSQFPGSAPGQQVFVPATFDNASKILRTDSQKFVAAVTFGAGAIGQTEPRTANSFMPEFEAEIAGDGRLTVERLEKVSVLSQLIRGVNRSAPGRRSLVAIMKESDVLPTPLSPNTIACWPLWFTASVILWSCSVLPAKRDSSLTGLAGVKTLPASMESVSQSILFVVTAGIIPHLTSV